VRGVDGRRREHLRGAWQVVALACGLEASGDGGAGEAPRDGEVLACSSVTRIATHSAAASRIATHSAAASRIATHSAAASRIATHSAAAWSHAQCSSRMTYVRGIVTHSAAVA
jgi:hypothetical protein